MIDALELLVPWEILRRKAFWCSRRSSQCPTSSGYNVLLHDETVQKVGLDGRHLEKPRRFPDAVLHTSRDGRRGNLRPGGHKLEFKRIRHLTADDINRRVLEYFDITVEQASDLRVVRVDFAVDAGVPLDWFRLHAEVRFKQSSEQFPGWKSEAKRRTRTLYFGSRSDYYRIYDKTAQKIDTNEPLLYPGLGSGTPPPTVTRIERQCTTRHVPSEVGTLRGLLSAAVTFDPFSRLVLHVGEGMPTMEGWSAQKWLCCVGLQAAVNETDIPTVRKRLNSLSGNKASRYFERYGDLLNAHPGVTKSDLLEFYFQSTRKQLYPAMDGPNPRAWIA